MESIVHYPTKPKDQKALSDRAASVHAEAILIYIGNLSCPKEQKLQLIKAIAQSLARKA